jgi:hypothetical protein
MFVVSLIISYFLGFSLAKDYNLVALLFSFCGTGVWTQGFTLAKQVLATWATPPVHFALVILEMGSPELFLQADLKPQSSWPQDSRVANVSHQHPAYTVFILAALYVLFSLELSFHLLCLRIYLRVSLSCFLILLFPTPQKVSKLTLFTLLLKINLGLIECMPSKQEALSSNSSIAKKKKKSQNQRHGT